MDVDECYQELGVAPGSSDAEVKAAWRRLAARWHPDRNASPQALRKIQRINRALEEIRRSRREMRADEAAEPSSEEKVIERTVDLTLEEIASGCVRELRGEVVEDCAACDGTGLEVHATTCTECTGKGRVPQPLWFAWMSPGLECQSCQGQGSRRLACAACSASGKAPARAYRCRVQIPPGLRAGDVLEATARVRGRQCGHSLRLRVRMQVQPHEFFSVEPDGTLTCEIPVDGFAWIANRWVEVPTADGLRQMRLKRGVLRYRVQGAGLPWQEQATCADCIIQVVPIFPDEFSTEQEAGIDRLVASNSGAAGTAAGRRAAAWTALVASWQARMGRGRAGSRS